MKSSPGAFGEKSETLGVLVVGTGHLGAQRAAATSLLTRRLRLVAVYDLNSSLAERVASRTGVVAVPTLAAGLESRGVDVVVVATPPEDHAETIRQALAAGKHVLCEAPLATRSRDGRSLAKRAAETQLKLATGFFRRFDPPIRDALTLVESWAVGRVESVRVEVGHQASLDFLQSWRTEVAHSGGGCLMHHGPVACDLIRRVLGEVVLAKGLVRQDVRMPPGCESEAFGLFRNHDNAFAELHASWNLPNPGLRLEVRGEAGWLKVQTTPWRLTGQLSHGRKLHRRYRANRVADRMHRVRYGCGRSIVAELNAFEGAATGFPTTGASGWDGHRVTEMIQAIYHSDRTGDEVHLKPSLIQVSCGAGR